MDDKQRKILHEWGVRANKAQIGHYKACNLYSNRHGFIGSLLVVVSTVLTALLFFQPVSEQARWIMTSLGIISTTLAFLQIFIKPNERAEKHRIFATKYGKLRREIESFISNPINDTDKTQVFIDNLKKEWNTVAEHAPLTPEKIRKEVKVIMLQDEKDINDFKS